VTIRFFWEKEKMLTVMVHGVRLGATLKEEKVLSKVVCEKLKKKWV
jgi:hypothetical protein